MLNELASVVNVKYVKIHPDAMVPTYATDGSGCYDFYSIEDGEVSEMRPGVFRTGLKFEIPLNYVMLIFSRSGQGFKYDIRLSNCTGIIDSDYRGEVSIKLAKDSSWVETKYLVSKGDRIAQGMVIPIQRANFLECTELSTTDRGEGGFHSTGR